MGVAMKLVRIALAVTLTVLSHSVFADVAGDFLAPKSSDQQGVLSLTVSKSITAKDYADLANLAGLIDKRYGDKWLVMADLNSTGGG
jgi:hypothetical protein